MLREIEERTAGSRHVVVIGLAESTVFVHGTGGEAMLRVCLAGKGWIMYGDGAMRREMIRLLAATLLTCDLFASPGMAGERTVGLITDTDDNPFFVTMKQAARGKAGALGLESPGTDFHDTGVTLVTNRPVPGIPSISSNQSLKECWG